MDDRRPTGTDGIDLVLPFRGLWLVQNSPARRDPSHGSTLFGERYAIDFVGVDDGRRTARMRDWRTLFSTEPLDRFHGFGRPILAPGSGIVAAVHAGEPDHEARRSKLALVPYALGQRARVAQGIGAIAGNYVIISLHGIDAFVALVHLRAGSIRVREGQDVAEGHWIAGCGNSGNSTQPHLHMQAMDRLDLSVAQGLPITFRRFHEWPRGAQESVVRHRAVPGEGSIVGRVPTARIPIDT